MAKLISLDFMAIRKFAMAVSICLVGISLLSLTIKGLNLGLDFMGGVAIELNYPHQPDPVEIRAQLAEQGYTRAEVQSLGNGSNLLIRLPDVTDGGEQQVGAQLINFLRQQEPGIELIRNDFIGAQFGKELQEKGILGVVVSLLMIMIYIAFRFQFKFSIAAVVALLHDVIIILGFFSLFNINFDLNVLVAILVIIGYSLNDTIVISDRIRENFRKLHKATPLEIVNLSVNQTLGRTTATSFTVLLVLFVLLFFGGEATYYLSLALTIGVIVGTYSSIYIAGTLMLWMKLKRQDLIILQEHDDKRLKTDRP